ncbi:effector binding domain-containing protein [Clostridiaceae bacterium M8S5]|nr:effector binding domain-containing protein [Clostridiaceae bacterium M8S5]
MNIEQVKTKNLLLGGMIFYGDPISVKGGWDTSNHIGQLWSRYSEFLRQNPVRKYSANKNSMYEIHIYNESTPTNGYFEVFVGEEVTSSKLPIDLCTKFIDESLYLKVTLSGDEITSDWWHKIINDNSIANMKLKPTQKYLIQVYDERFKGMDNIENSTMYALVPLEEL